MAFCATCFLPLPRGGGDSDPDFVLLPSLRLALLSSVAGEASQCRCPFNGTALLDSPLFADLRVVTMVLTPSPHGWVAMAPGLRAMKATTIEKLFGRSANELECLSNGCARG